MNNWYCKLSGLKDESIRVESIKWMLREFGLDNKRIEKSINDTEILALSNGSASLAIPIDSNTVIDFVCKNEDHETLANKIKQSEWLNCPKCNSENITADRFDASYEVAYRNVTCLTCGFEWVEVYEFSHNESSENGSMLDENGEEA
mgnify:FL=1